MPYSFNPLSGNLDFYKNSSQTYTEFIFDSDGTQSANRFNDWGDLYTALQATEGIKRVTFDSSAVLAAPFFNDIIPAGTYNLDNTILRGRGGSIASGTGTIIQLADGVTISSWANAKIEGGLGLVSVSTSPIMTVTDFNMTVDGGSALMTAGAFGATYWFSHSTGVLQINLSNGSALYGNGDLGGAAGTLINKTNNGTVILIAGSNNSNVSANVVAGTLGEVQITSGEASSSAVYGNTQSGFSGTRDDDRLAKATNVKYNPATSGLTSVDVQSAIDETVGLLADSEPLYSEPPVVTTKVMRLDYAGNPGVEDGAWSTPDVGDLTSGVDLRARIWFDYPSDVTPPTTDRYMEIITQEHPTADGGDTFEAAILWADDTFGAGVIEGQPHLFWEAAKTSIGTGMETNAGWIRAGIKAREWLDVRFTQNFSTNTVTYWRAVPYEVNADCEQVDGIWYYPVSSVTNADFSGIDTAATSDWWIGLRFTGYIAKLKMTNTAGTTTYVDINETDLDALTVGDQSFTDDASNTWTSVAAEIVEPPDITESGNTWSFTNVTTDRTVDANATSVNELADALGTLVQELKDKGILT